MEALKQSPLALQYVNESLKRDKNIVLEAVSRMGIALQYADESLKKDRDVVIAAVSQNAFALNYADESLRNDPNLLQEIQNTKEEESYHSAEEIGEGIEPTQTGMNKVVDEITTATKENTITQGKDDKTEEERGDY